ncbi:ATP-grasp domain-containing protein [Streptomyces sp. TR06-5]|uniref:ATP-grasp domain-containing protein n=1 Tax=unclassified Streptomyces TaxID=2593676 RepID=UPI0039A1887C
MTSDKPDSDFEATTRALETAGLTWTSVDWKDQHAPWTSCRAAMVRSTWDYAENRDSFLASMHRASIFCDLVNPFDVLAWNTDKTYLRDLADSGCAVVPTLWVDPNVCNSRSALTSALPREWTDIVVKPTVGAGGSGAMRTRSAEKASAYAVSGGPVLVQPYLNSVDTEGEFSLVYLDGKFSHAVRRGPYLRPETLRGSLLVPETADSEWDVAPCNAEEECREVAEQALRTVPVDNPLLYARVDLLRDDEGRMRIAELELTEPFLFLEYAEGAADRLASALRDRLTAEPGPLGRTSQRSSR